MQLTGKNKEQFDKWYGVKYRMDLKSSMNPNNYSVSVSPPRDAFYNLPFEMQLGVYLDYYDSLGIDIIIDVLINDEHEKRYTCWINDDCIMSCESRNEAYKEAFKKADDLINQQEN